MAAAHRVAGRDGVGEPDLPQHIHSPANALVVNGHAGEQKGFTVPAKKMNKEVKR